MNDNNNKIGKVYLYAPIKSSSLKLTVSVDKVNSVSKSAETSADSEKKLVTRTFRKMMKNTKKIRQLIGEENGNEDENGEEEIEEKGEKGEKGSDSNNAMDENEPNIDEEYSVFQAPADGTFFSWSLVALLTSESLSMEIAHKVTNNNNNEDAAKNGIIDITETPNPPSIINTTSSTTSPASSSSTSLFFSSLFSRMRNIYFEKQSFNFYSHSDSITSTSTSTSTSILLSAANKRQSRELVEYYNEIYQINSGNKRLKEAYGSYVAFLGMTQNIFKF